MKACIDCKHMSMENAINNAPRCARFGRYTETHDIVWGTTKHLAAPDCRTAREDTGQCGPKGRSWESRYATQRPAPQWREQSIADPPPQNPDPPRKKRWYDWLALN